MTYTHRTCRRTTLAPTQRCRCPPCELSSLRAGGIAQACPTSHSMTCYPHPPGPPKALAPTGDRAGAVRPGAAGAAAREACRRRARSLQCVCDGAHAAAGREVRAKARSMYRTAERASSTAASYGARAMASCAVRVTRGLLCCARPRRACVRGEDYAAYRTEVLDIVQELHRAKLVSHAFSRCLEQHCRSRMGVPAFDGAAWCVFVCARWSARVCSSLLARWCAERPDATSLSAQIVTPGAQISLPGAQILLSCASSQENNSCSSHFT
jgi:hypothetical protein